ncbi:hypothetical protein Rleg10DRAFT_3780 [Rhizobium leguminosarum bv. trifolii WSM2012]|nr:hypothetical protein Rleg10DRAFT_3780 [Rhizobium leguminosarum bv. trifolii WSM2012]
MHLLPFAAGVFTLLILPGPTNAILAIASQGLTSRRATTLLATVVFAYLAVVLSVSSLAAPVLRDHPPVSQAVKLASATWVFYLALRLWGVGSSPVTVVRTRQLAITTLLNPKGFIIGLTIIPAAQQASSIAIVSVLASLVLLASAVWLSIGRIVLGGEKKIPLFARRFSSATLFIFSATLTASVF